MADKLEIKLVRSMAGTNDNQKRNLKALGLKRREHTVVHDDSGTIRGMISKVAHLVKVTKRQD